MTPYTTFPGKRRALRSVQLHLPILTGEEALLIADLLDRVIAALWRVHGPDMIDLLARLGTDTLPLTDLDIPDVFPFDDVPY